MSNGLVEVLGGQEKANKSNPMGRIGQPQDIAGAVVYLASRASGHVNGGVVAIDGGKVWARSEL